MGLKNLFNLGRGTAPSGLALTGNKSAGELAAGAALGTVMGGSGVYIAGRLLGEDNGEESLTEEISRLVARDEEKVTLTKSLKKEEKRLTAMKTRLAHLDDEE